MTKPFRWEAACLADDPFAGDFAKGWDRAAALAAAPTIPATGDGGTMTKTLEEMIAEAIEGADNSFSYSFNLTRLVDGVETHTLTMAGFDPVDFEDRGDGYRLISERRNALRAKAILATIPATGHAATEGEGA